MKDIILSFGPVLSIPLTVIAWWVVHSLATPGTIVSFLGISYTKRDQKSFRHTDKNGGRKSFLKKIGANLKWENGRHVSDTPKWVKRWRNHVQTFPNAKSQLKTLRYIYLCLGTIFIYPALAHMMGSTFDSSFLNYMSGMSMAIFIGSYIAFLVVYVLEKITGNM